MSPKSLATMFAFRSIQTLDEAPLFGSSIPRVIRIRFGLHL